MTELNKSQTNDVTKIPGNQRLNRKHEPTESRSKSQPNLTFSALCGLAISYLFKSYFLLRPFYTPVLYTCLYACTKETTAHSSSYSPFCAFVHSGEPSFLSFVSLLKNSQVQILPPQMTTWPRSFPGFSRDCSLLPLAPTALPVVLQ